MARCLRVDDPADPRLADYLRLTDVTLRRRIEPAGGLFVAEGRTVLQRALQRGCRLRSVLLDPRHWPELGDLLSGPEVDPEVPVYLVGQPVLRVLTGIELHRGVLASFARPPCSAPEAVLAGAHRALVLEGLNNPTNVGAVFRSAAALGMDAVLLSPTCADPLYRRALRTSMGATLSVPFARVSRWPEAVEELRRQGFRVLGLTPGPGAVPLAREVARLRTAGDQAGRIAVLLGAEWPGVSPEALARVDVRVAIEMANGVDSLNVAAAAAIACYALSGVLPRAGASALSAIPMDAVEPDSPAGTRLGARYDRM